MKKKQENTNRQVLTEGSNRKNREDCWEGCDSEMKVCQSDLHTPDPRIGASAWKRVKSSLMSAPCQGALERESKREERDVCKHTANVQTWVHTRSDEYALSSDKTRLISILYLFFLCCRLFVYGNIPDSKTGIDHSVSSQTRRRYKQHKPDLYVGVVAVQAMGSQCVFSAALGLYLRPNLKCHLSKLGGMVV